MTAAPYNDADAAAEAMSAAADRRLEAEARQLSGIEGRTVRLALEAATSVLAKLNTKGLPFALRHQIEACRRDLVEAGAILKKRNSAGGRAAG